jgi:hypothetical protein
MKTIIFLAKFFRTITLRTKGLRLKVSGIKVFRNIDFRTIVSRETFLEQKT